MHTADSKIQQYLKTEQLRKEQYSAKLTKAHYEKAIENLDFCEQVQEKIQQHPSWVIISAYYAAYHAALALLANKGYSSKSHTATIAAIKELYILSKESIKTLEQLSKTAIDTLEDLKEKRELASYNISKQYNKIIANETRLKAQQFILEVKDILHY